MSKRKRPIINMILTAELDEQLIPLSPPVLQGERCTRKRVETALREYIDILNRRKGAKKAV